MAITIKELLKNALQRKEKDKPKEIEIDIKNIGVCKFYIPSESEALDLGSKGATDAEVVRTNLIEPKISDEIKETFKCYDHSIVEHLFGKKAVRDIAMTIIKESGAFENKVEVIKN